MSERPKTITENQLTDALIDYFDALSDFERNMKADPPACEPDPAHWWRAHEGPVASWQWHNIEAAIRAAALDEARAAVEHSGLIPESLAGQIALAAIDALREGER